MVAQEDSKMEMENLCKGSVISFTSEGRLLVQKISAGSVCAILHFNVLNRTFLPKWKMPLVSQCTKVNKYSVHDTFLLECFTSGFVCCLIFIVLRLQEWQFSISRAV